MIYFNSLFAFTCNPNGYYILNPSVSPNPSRNANSYDDSLAYNFGVTVGTPSKESCSGNTAFKIIFTWGGMAYPPRSYATQYNYITTPNNPCTASGQVYDATSYSCKVPPAVDSDGDGIPDKCDKKASNFASLDCDGDGIPNSTDNDIDGDGVPNENDANPTDSNNATTCPVNSYDNIPGVIESDCVMSNSKFQAPNGSLYYTSSVLWDSCRQMCSSRSQGCPRGQSIKDGQCRNVEPDIGDCVGTSVCHSGGNDISALDGSSSRHGCYKTCYCLTNSNPTPSASNKYFFQEVSCTDNLSDKDKLGNSRSENDNNISSPNPLADSNGTLNYDFATSVKAALDSYGGSKESTSLKQLREAEIQSLQLVNANTNLGNINSNLENFSNAATMNQGVINTTLNGIKDGQNIGNGLLLGIKDGVDKADGLLEDIKKLLDDNGTDNNSSRGNLDFLSNEISNILNKYTINLGSSNCAPISSVSFVFHGRTVTVFSQSMLDMLPMSSIKTFIVFLFTILAISLVFRGN